MSVGVVGRLWESAEGKKCVGTASLSQRPPKSTEYYSPQLHLHLQAHYSHSHYSKQTSRKTCARAAHPCTHSVYTHTHDHTASHIHHVVRTVCFSGRPRSRHHRHNAPDPCTLLHWDFTSVNQFLFSLSTRNWQSRRRLQNVPLPPFLRLLILIPSPHGVCFSFSRMPIQYFHSTVAHSSFMPELQPTLFFLLSKTLFATRGDAGSLRLDGWVVCVCAEERREANTQEESLQS